MATHTRRQEDKRSCISDGEFEDSISDGEFEDTKKGLWYFYLLLNCEGIGR